MPFRTLSVLSPGATASRLAASARGRGQRVLTVEAALDADESALLASFEAAYPDRKKPPTSIEDLTRYVDLRSGSAPTTLLVVARCDAEDADGRLARRLRDALREVRSRSLTVVLLRPASADESE